MALEPMLWALKAAPVADAEERLILVAIAEAARKDGTEAYLSQATLAKRALVAERTVRRRLGSLEERALIRRGDQSVVENNPKIPADKRPVVWDVMVPLSYYRDVEEMQQDRATRGLAPLTAAQRPNHGEAPAPKRRADVGKPKPPKATTSEDESDRTTSPAGQEVRPDSEAGATGLQVHGRPDYKSANQTTNPNHPNNQDSGDARSAHIAAAGAEKADDGQGTIPGTEDVAPPPPPGETLPQQAERVTRGWWDAMMLRPVEQRTTQSYPAVKGIVATALKTEQPERLIVAALDRLLAEGRSITGGSLRIAMTELRKLGPDGVRRRSGVNEAWQDGSAQKSWQAFTQPKAVNE